MDTELAAQSSALPVPTLGDGFAIRPGILSDMPFVDQLQKHYSGALGFLWDTAIEAKIANGDLRVIVDQGGTPYGFCLGQHRYTGCDHCGVIYQLAVVPMKQRKLYGAALIRNFFHTAPYGMKLCCCWCAQDLQANHFWEAMGFVPLAFRTGSRGKQRIHIFWQRRVREGDTRTPFWFPAKTGQGSINEDRIVIPIPPGVSWRDAKPVLLPGSASDVPLLPNGMPDPAYKRRNLLAGPGKPASTPLERVRVIQRQLCHSRGPKLVELTDSMVPVKPPKAPRPRRKENVELVAAARELRDRYLDLANEGHLLEAGKYSPARRLEEAPSSLHTPAGASIAASLAQTMPSARSATPERLELIDSGATDSMAVQR